MRPHAKTHKTLEAAEILGGGTRRRIVVSTLAEAEFFADGGFDDILYAVPISAAKLPRAAALAGRLESFHVSVDSPEGLDQVLAAAPPEGKPWSIFLMVDCGYGREGLDPAGPAALEMARLIQGSPRARLAGLYTHGGHSYDPEGAEGAAARVRQIAAEEAAAVVGLAGRLRAAGVEVETVGVGSTPTCSNPPAEGLEGVTEMHPGNYCYYDVMQERLGSCTEADIAVRVACRVIGRYPERGLLLVDMGWTGCSKQGASCGFGRIEGHPELVLAELKQESGLIRSADGSPLDFSRYPLGTILRVEPYHSCAHTKQHDRVHVLGEDRETVEQVWRICQGW